MTDLGVIVDGQRYWACDMDAWAKRPEIQALVQQRKLTMRPTNDLAKSAEAAPCYVNHGRLFARCWSRGCGGAELVWWDRPQLWCSSCGNAELNGRWRPVALPDEAALVVIERELARRPEHERNWSEAEGFLP